MPAANKFVYGPRTLKTVAPTPLEISECEVKRLKSTLSRGQWLMVSAIVKTPSINTRDLEYFCHQSNAHKQKAEINQLLKQPKMALIEIPLHGPNKVWSWFLVGRRYAQVNYPEQLRVVRMVTV